MPALKAPTSTTDWRHAPAHRLGQPGAYMVTSGCYQKKSLFATRSRLTFLSNALLELTRKYDWRLQSWAIFPNHYHFVAESRTPESLRTLTRHLHSISARYVNEIDGTPERKVWFQYWDTHLSYERSYLARLGYVHLNAVKHGLVQRPQDYWWCSAGWLRSGNSEGSSFAKMESSVSGIGAEDDYDVPHITDE